MGRVFSIYEVPVAYSMFALARRVSREEPQAFHEYIFCWTAFNNIYTALAEYAGLSPQLRKRADGAVATRWEGGVEIPAVDTPTERDQIELACADLGDELKHNLITHESTRFFVYRTPIWRGNRIETDNRGQRLNGVLSVNRTVSSDYPVWSPIDTDAYEHYVRHQGDTGQRDELTRQLVNVLYTARNNLVHGGKQADDANDREVLEKATPLLTMIVESFLAEDELPPQPLPQAGEANR